MERTQADDLGQVDVQRAASVPNDFDSLHQAFFQIPRKYAITGKVFTHSEELNRVIATAARLAPNKIVSFDRAFPLITPELFLFATTRTEGVELGRKLGALGLRLDLLEAAAIERHESPEKLMF